MSFEQLLDQPLNPGVSGDGPDGDIALSSRVRLARNLEGLPFPNRAGAEQLATVTSRLKTTLYDLNADAANRYMFVELRQLSALERNMLVEKHVISPVHAQDPDNRAVLVRDDLKVSIMVNEEDHIRIQCLAPGLDLATAARLADRIDDLLENRLDYAFHEQMGYLTACPTNPGTGLRASVMLHLPALTMTRQVGRMIAAATRLGLAVRGMYGEGTEPVGNIFQVSNQLTLGHSEQEIVDNLNNVARQVVQHERTARQSLLRDSRETMEDRVWRAYGVLTHARSISGQEALTLLSEVRLGADMGLIDCLPSKAFHELLVTTRPNFLQKTGGGGDLEPDARDRLRATVIRDTLKGGTSDV